MLTGKTRYRTGWFGRLILQVEEQIGRTDPMTCETDYFPRWRDAKAEDLLSSGVALTCGPIVSA